MLKSPMITQVLFSCFLVFLFSCLFSCSSSCFRFRYFRGHRARPVEAGLGVNGLILSAVELKYSINLSKSPFGCL